jgi:hypothetical protein
MEWVAALFGGLLLSGSLFYLTDEARPLRPALRLVLAGLGCGFLASGAIAAYSIATQEDSTSAASARLRQQEAPKVAVYGYVLEETSRPVTGAKVRLTGPLYAGNMARNIEGATDDKGYYYVNLGSAGAYNLIVTADLYEPYILLAQVDLPDIQGEEEAPTVVLRRRADVRVQAPGPPLRESPLPGDGMNDPVTFPYPRGIERAQVAPLLMSLGHIADESEIASIVDQTIDGSGWTTFVRQGTTLSITRVDVTSLPVLMVTLGGGPHSGGLLCVHLASGRVLAAPGSALMPGEAPLAYVADAAAEATPTPPPEVPADPASPPAAAPVESPAPQPPAATPAPPAPQQPAAPRPTIAEPVVPAPAYVPPVPAAPPPPPAPLPPVPVAPPQLPQVQLPPQIPQLPQLPAQLPAPLPPVPVPPLPSQLPAPLPPAPVPQLPQLPSQLPAPLPPVPLPQLPQLPTQPAAPRAPGGTPPQLPVLPPLLPGLR